MYREERGLFSTLLECRNVQVRIESDCGLPFKNPKQVASLAVCKFLEDIGCYDTAREFRAILDVSDSEVE